MPALDGMVDSSEDHVARARRTAAVSRVAVGAAGVLLLLAHPSLVPVPAAALAGFVLIQLTSLVQLAAPRLAWLSLEESLSGTSALLIIGLGSQRVSVLSILWLTAVASGVLARGGRLHWVGRALVVTSLLAPVLRYGGLSAEYAALCVAVTGLLLTSGRLTRELNDLLGRARLQADSAETLLLAGDIASRVERRADGPQGARESGEPPPALGQRELEGVRSAIGALIAGEGLTMVVQPIVDIHTGRAHAFEALARFSSPHIQDGPLGWFALAERLGRRPELERACLAGALELYRTRPPGTGVSVNLSAPVLLDPQTQDMIEASGGGGEDGLRGLIVEITEETLAQGEMDLAEAFRPLRERGACLAVDDMGAGYSGLRQITAVLPRYLKLDRSLVTGIDSDSERSALVSALAGYSRQVGCLLVVEGVESAAELAAVRRLGVTLVQGFVFARPGPPWPRVAEPASVVEGEQGPAAGDALELVHAQIGELEGTAHHGSEHRAGHQHLAGPR
jgi:EAL domain-containing protein (putative c-di-GMP-specific phosphodiesterase class I)